MTLVSSLIDEVRAYLRDTTDNSGQTFFSDSEFIGYFNRSIREICYETDINARTYTKTYDAAAIAALADASVISFLDITDSSETDVFEINEIVINPASQSDTDWYKLRIVNAQDNKTYADYSDVITAEVYDNEFHLNIDIQENDKLGINARWVKAKLTATTDTYPLNIVSESATIAHAVAFGFYKKAQFEAGDRWRAEYDKRKADVKKIVQVNRQTNSPSGLKLHKEPITVAVDSFLNGRTIPFA